MSETVPACDRHIQSVVQEALGQTGQPWHIWKLHWPLLNAVSQTLLPKVQRCCILLRARESSVCFCVARGVSWPHDSGRQPEGRPVPSMPSPAGAYQLAHPRFPTTAGREVHRPAKLHHVLLFPVELRRLRQPSPAILLVRCAGSSSCISNELNWTWPHLE